MKKSKRLKAITILLCCLLIFQQTGFAQVAAVELNISGYFAQTGNPLILDKFRPLHLRYISYDGLNNNFKLLLDKGDTQNLKTQDIESTTKDLLNYFFVGIALPNDTFWVNLRPDSPNDIIDPLLAQTQVGKILLEADLQLKKDTANATNPGTPEGKAYWDKLYQKAGELYGNQNVTIPTLTRPWIVPDEIIIRESTDSAYVYKATLKVMLEQDYLKGSSTYSFKDEREKQLNEYSSQIIREKILPKLTKDISSAKRYAPLRQVYYSLILAQWFKARQRGLSLKGTVTGFVPGLIDKKDLSSLQSQSPYSVATYFNAYKENFEKGEYNVKEPTYTPYGQVIRSYFSGGITNIAPEIPDRGQPTLVNSTGTRITVVPGVNDPSVGTDTSLLIKATSSGSLALERASSPVAIASFKKMNLIVATVLSLLVSTGFDINAQVKGAPEDSSQLILYSNDKTSLEKELINSVEREFREALSSAPKPIKQLLAAKSLGESRQIIEFLLKKNKLKLPFYAAEDISNLVSSENTGDNNFKRLERFKDALSSLREHQPWVFRFIMFNTPELIYDREPSVIAYASNGKTYYGDRYTSASGTITGLLLHEAIHNYLEKIGMPPGGPIGESVAIHLEDILGKEENIRLGEKEYRKQLPRESQNKEHWGKWQDLYYARTGNKEGAELSNHIKNLEFIVNLPSALEDIYFYAKEENGPAVFVLKLFENLLDSVGSKSIESKKIFTEILLQNIDWFWNAGNGLFRDEILRYASRVYFTGEEWKKLLEQTNKPDNLPFGGKDQGPLASSSSPVRASSLVTDKNVRILYELDHYKRAEFKQALQEEIKKADVVILEFPEEAVPLLQELSDGRINVNEFVKRLKQIYSSFGGGSMVFENENQILYDIIYHSGKIIIGAERLKSNILDIAGNEKELNVALQQGKFELALERFMVLLRKMSQLMVYRDSYAREVIKRVQAQNSDKKILVVRGVLHTFIGHTLLADGIPVERIFMGRHLQEPLAVFRYDDVIIRLFMRDIEGNRISSIPVDLAARAMLTNIWVNVLKMQGQRISADFAQMNRAASRLKFQDIKSLILDLISGKKAWPEVETYLAVLSNRGPQSASSPIENRKQNVENPALDTKGGIDFRFLPIVTQSMDSLKANIRGMPQSSLQRINLIQEWSDIERLVNSGITPSGERLKEYLAASCFKDNLDNDMEKITFCISNILRSEEETCSSTDPMLKDILVALGSGRSEEELKVVFSGVI